jgi:dihydroorotate dehydrogenase
MFRLPAARAIINRMGFNNHGVDALVANVLRARFRGVLGINIGKNFDTPIERAADDYLICLRKVYAHASYVTVNISSPNTKNLRQLQQTDELGQLLAALQMERERLADRHGRRIPLALKIAPDLDPSQISAIAGLLVAHRIDAVIATNTTTARDAVAQLPHGAETGGLSGAPLTAQAQSVTAQLAAALGGAVPVIGVGGIMNGSDAAARIHAGASLIQLYTGLVYAGPALVGACIKACAQPAP